MVDLGLFAKTTENILSVNDGFWMITRELLNVWLYTFMKALLLISHG